MDEESFSAVAKNLLEIIRFGKLTSEGLRVPANLQTMRDNIRKETKKLTEIEQNHLLEEIKLQLQGSNPRLATKLYGPREQSAKDELQSIYDQLSLEYDFNSSTVKEGVKIGGDMIAGRLFVDVYFSYKNKEKWHTTFAIIQEEYAEPQSYKIAIYHSGRNDPSLIDTYFPLNEREDAIKLFKSYLDRLMPRS